MKTFEALSEDVCQNLEYVGQSMTMKISSKVEKTCVMKRSLEKQSSAYSRSKMVQIVSITCFGSLIEVCAVCFIDALPHLPQPLKASATIAAVTCFNSALVCQNSSEG